MRRKYLIALFMCLFLLILTACQDKLTDNSNIGNLSVSDTGVLNVVESYESKEEAKEYTAYTNFVKKNDAGKYDLIFDKLEYNGGEFDIDVEFEFEGRGEETESVDALAMFFVDGYMQEFSLDNDEKTFVHKITIQNNALMHLNYKSVLRTFDNSLDKHTICTVILPYWRLGGGYFYRDNVKMSMTREIILNTINSPKDDIVVQMNIRERTNWDREHSELPFRHGDLNTDLTFHCFKAHETCCYVFCGGELFSQDGKYIFESSNTDPDKTTFQNISVDESDVGKSLFILSVSKSNFDVETTCNYLWDESE